MGGRRRCASLLLLPLLLAATACDGGGGDDGDDGLRVVVGSYPLEYLVRGVLDDAGTVTNLTPAGSEPHDVELATDDLDRIEDADLVLYVGGGFQPAVERAAEQRGEHALDVLDAVGGGDDPHFWLDPVLMSRATTAVEEALVGIVDGDTESGVRGRAAAVRATVDQIHRRFEERLGLCERRVIVTEHDAFGRLAERYGLVTRSIAGSSPESEPDADRLAELATFVRDEGITTIFSETLAASRASETLAREAGVKTAVLDAVEGGGGEYQVAMQANLDALSRALDCASSIEPTRAPTPSPAPAPTSSP